MQRVKVYKYLTIFFLILTVALTFTNVTFHSFCNTCAASGYFPNFYLLALANNFLHLSMFVYCPTIESLPCTSLKIIPIETIFLSLVFGTLWYRAFHGKTIKLRYLAIGILLIGLGVLGGLAFGTLALPLSYKKVPVEHTREKAIPSHSVRIVGEIYEFTGIATDFDDGCVVDGECILYVDNIIPIIVNPGDVDTASLGGLGTFDVFGTDENEIVGRTVQVRAIKTKTGYTLVGDESLYVK